ncbi:MAG: riboflavin synthase [Verrucomicrobia bacterium]|nr:riboflavin synthase [Verrucomicrobiota bacterium]
MFTGIIQKAGRVSEMQTDAATGRLCIEVAPWEDALETGESIAVNGVCLTLVAHTENRLQFDVLQETFARTNLGKKQLGSVVNLERAVRHGDPLGGHVVSGHIDGVGVLKSIRAIGRDRIVTVACPNELIEEVVFKGSVAIDGISLTVAALADESFDVHIIPHTWDNTDLSGLGEGSTVNLETDVIAKYVRRMIEKGVIPLSVDWNEIRKNALLNGKVARESNSSAG